MRLNPKIILLILTFLFLPIITYAQDCQLAIPRYGIIQCVNASEEKTIRLDIGEEYKGDWSINTLKCLSYCIIKKKYIDINCRSSHTEEYQFIKNGEQINNTFPITWGRGDKLIFKVRCTAKNNTYNLREGSYIEYNQRVIIFYEGWNETTLEKPIGNTTDCSYKTFKRAEVDVFLDPTDGTIRLKPDSTYESLGKFPENWRVGDYYTYVRAWETELGDITFTYDKYNNYYWCGGEKESRIIYEAERIYDPNGKCYDVPIAIYSSGLECCFDSDCEHLGEKYVCDPDTWSCEQTRWCDSTPECKELFGEDTCEEDTLNTWKCNIYRPWGEYKGSCELEIMKVKECPQDCERDYNYEKGECVVQEEQENLLIQGYAVANPVKLELSLLQKIILLICMIIIIIEVIYYLWK
ncbi:MAG: hypothetical protein JSW73_03590 [Candidatus Woesearchaeota archaeon]|nr:MAG: hypothetical protein JSW73_03590 [Candidatus Woesearchaeota archaeon]